MLAPPLPLPREVRQNWGFDLIRIQLPHPPGNIRIQIPPSESLVHGVYTGNGGAWWWVTGDLTGHVYTLRAFHAGAHSRTLVTILINNNTVIHNNYY